jgi:hypothetical protein
VLCFGCPSNKRHRARKRLPLEPSRAVVSSQNCFTDAQYGAMNPNDRATPEGSGAAAPFLMYLGGTLQGYDFMRKLIPALIAIAFLSGCVGTYGPVERGVQGAAGGAAAGCAMGALMTVWAGPVAAAGCAMGAVAGAGMGSMMGVATAPELPPAYR